MFNKLFCNKIKVKDWRFHGADDYPIDNVIPVDKEFKYTYVTNKTDCLKKLFKEMCGTYQAYYKFFNSSREPRTINLYLVSGKHTYMLEFHGYYGNENDSIYIVDYYKKEQYVIDLTYNSKKANIIGNENEKLYNHYLLKIIKNMREISLGYESYNHKQFEIRRLNRLQNFKKESDRWYNIFLKYVDLHYKSDLNFMYNYRESFGRGEIYIVDKDNRCKIMLIFEYGCTSSDFSYWINKKRVYYSTTNCLFGYPLTGTNVCENHEDFINKLKYFYNDEISYNK